MKRFPFSHEIHNQVSLALMEDWGSEGDLTSILVSSSSVVCVELIVNEHATLCGQQWFDTSFFQVDPSVRVKWFFNDGDTILPGTIVAEVCGCARSVFSTERVALNFLQMLSGVATRTSKFVSLVKHTKCQILDSRKTIPGLRLAQKYAVRCGGGENHRSGLYDMILIKDNHINAVGGVTEAYNRIKKEHRFHSSGLFPVMIEVDTLEQLREALSCGIDMIMLDNMELSCVREAVKINDGRAVLEVSGGITENTVSSYAETGVDRISIGALTKSIVAVDFSLQVRVSHVNSSATTR
ncbi:MULTISPECIES: carboxylating nicotinate-nucleotide diphosphorylase [Candidatus Ichthyocystis]|uniref:carboxylating nicotinate-nucleotide diphosphorylase n=1 Tax=Candidatus Ichthyocystis TaxID=2929841 RepID=UPI000AC5BEC4|nr:MULTISPECIES: carboxylating nicotinate-nucleotide diphosphorylase [Ichthyocystis]